MKYRLWCLAEEMDFAGRFPRRFWRWLLVKLDREHGHNNLTYDD